MHLFCLVFTYGRLAAAWIWMLKVLWYGRYTGCLVVQVLQSGPQTKYQRWRFEVSAAVAATACAAAGPLHQSVCGHGLFYLL